MLVGGPPCQAFARVGRAKLRSEALRRKESDAENAHVNDDRANLYVRYLHYVRELRPVALLMENVPDMLNQSGRNLAEIVRASLAKMGYVTKYTLLNAANYGVPQTRERMFLIAYHRSLGKDVEFPVPTHRCKLPPGYENTRASARRLVSSVGPDEDLGHRWVDMPQDEAELPPATTARQALADLPPIYALELLNAGTLVRGRKDPSEPVRYTKAQPSTPWSTLMRRWPKFSTTETTTGHVIRYLPRDYKIFKYMDEGWQYPRIWQFVEDKRQRLLDARWKANLPTDGRNPEVKKLVKEWTLPYDPAKFPNKWWKLDADKPVRTLLAHLGKDSYSHIHYEREEARPISVREAARLQSFPDGFAFRGSLNPAFKQIGNAVPPLMSYALAMGVRKALGCQAMTDIRVEHLGLDKKKIRYTGGRAR